MYLYGQSRGLGIVATMPAEGLRSRGPIRPSMPAPIVSVNKPIVNIPVAAPKPVTAAPASMLPASRSMSVGTVTYQPLPPQQIAPTSNLRVAQFPDRTQWNAPQAPIVYAPERPVTTPVKANTGTPVPTGYPTSQLFVNSDGSFWQYNPASQNWVNVGTPYNTGASATPAAPAPSSSGASTAPPANTTAPAPVNVSVAPAAAQSSYQAILDWLQQDSLLSSIGFAGTPNWIVAGAGVLLAYKVSAGRKR